ncbi:hypothetical protein ACQJ2E_24880, partial [Klebsiella aerogenes]
KRGRRERERGEKGGREKREGGKSAQQGSVREEKEGGERREKGRWRGIRKGAMQESRTGRRMGIGGGGSTRVAAELIAATR